MMDRILLVLPANSYRAGAFLEAARSLQVPVAVAGDREHPLAAAAPGAQLAINFDEPEEATDSILDFARDYPLQAILTPDDEGLILAAMASDALGLSTNRTAAVAAAHNKYLMRLRLSEAGLPSPWFQRFPLSTDPAGVATKLAYPCVLKPLTLSGSRGVIRADNPQEFSEAFHRIRAILAGTEVQARQGAMAQHILVEGYIPGQEVALEGLVTNGTLKSLAIFDKPDPLEGPFFEETIYVTPSRHPLALQKAITQSCTAGAAALGITDGPLHAELRFNPQGIWIIEIAPRSIGGHCSRALRFNEDLSLEGLVLKHALGQEVTQIERELSASGVMMIPIQRAGTLQKVKGIKAAGAVESIQEILITIPPGSQVLPLPEGNQYLGFLFARARTPGQVEHALRAAHEKLQFVIY